MVTEIEDYGHWTLAEGVVHKDTDIGFVYKIVLKSGQTYIGKKSMISTRKKPVKLKNGNIVKRKTISESDWKNYTSSSTTINEYIKEHGKHGIQFIILSFHSSKSHLSYYEAKLQFDNNVLFDENSLNGIINLRISKLTKGGY